MGWIVAAIPAYVLPGLALLWLSGLADQRPWSERLLLALGVGAAWAAVWILATDVLNIPLGVWHVWLPAGLGLLVLLWTAIRSRLRPASVSTTPTDVIAHPQSFPPDAALTASDSARARVWLASETFWATLTLWLVVGLIVVSRLWAVRGLVAPMWGDSVQHAVMAQLMLDQGGVFDSWLPYTPYAGLTIQYGFSALTAFFAWATWAWDRNMAGMEATLIAGQLVNSMAVLTVYPLAVRVAGGNRWAGIGALVVAGLWMPMPAFYVNWGRYAQLAGQVILPVAIWLIWEVAARPRVRGFGWLLTGLVVAGMVLTYYRTPFYLATFLVAWFFCWWLPTKRLDWRAWWRAGLALLLAAATTAVIFVPWLLRIQGSSLSAGMEATPEVTDLFSLESVLADYADWVRYADYVPLPLGLLAIGAWLLGIGLRRGNVILVGGWTLLLAASVAGRLLALPGSLFLQNFAVLIALYIPVSILCGWLLAWIMAQMAARLGRWQPALAAALLTLAALGGYPTAANVVNPVHAMVLPADLQAMAWISDHTPPDAHFLVEGFEVYGGLSVVGADAGWWIPLVTGRSNTMPPQYALMNERPIDPTYNQQLLDLYLGLAREGVAAPATRDRLCAQGITHLYIGERQGMVGNPGAPLFPPPHVATLPMFQVVYQENNVWIFAFDRTTCPVTAG